VENVEIPKDRVLLTLRDRDDLMSSWSLSSALDFTVPAMPVTRILIIIRRLGKASARFRFGPTRDSEARASRRARLHMHRSFTG
jgi:hypothetical protein